MQLEFIYTLYLVFDIIVTNYQYACYSVLFALILCRSILNKKSNVDGCVIHVVLVIYFVFLVFMPSVQTWTAHFATVILDLYTNQDNTWLCSVHEPFYLRGRIAVQFAYKPYILFSPHFGKFFCAVGIGTNKILKHDFLLLGFKLVCWVEI